MQAVATPTYREVDTIPGGGAVAPPARRPWHRRVVAAIAAAAAAAWLPFLALPLSPDEGGFLMVAAQWRPGISLYGDYWVDRPPLLIGLFQLADLGGGAVALRLLGIVAVVASVLLASRLGRLLAPRQPAAEIAAAATAAVFMSTPLFGTTEVDGELLAVPLVLGGLVALVRAAASPRGTGRRWWTAAGVLATAAAAVKQSEVDVLVAAAATAVLLVSQRRRPADLGVAAGCFAAGVLGALGLLLAWSAARGTYPSGLWDAVVTFRGEAAAVIHASASDATDRRASLLTTSALVSGAAGLLVVAVVPGRRRRLLAALPPAPLDARVLALAVLTWEVVVVTGGGSYWLHYLIATVPGLVLLVVATARHRPGRVRWLAGALGYAAVAAVVAIVAVLAGVRGSRSDLVVEDYLADHAAAGDTGVVAFGDPAILQAAGLHSPYPLVWSLPVRVRDPHLTHFTRVLRGPERPTWVVVDGQSLDTWGVDATTAQPVLDREYRLCRVIGDWHVYHLRPEAG